MKTQVHGDMFHTITQIDKLRRVIAQLEQMESVLDDIYDISNQFYEHPAVSKTLVADAYNTLHDPYWKTLELLNERLSLLESSLIVE
jgi:hypothetical protein